MKLFKRCILTLAIIATVAVSYRHANSLWWDAQINDDGTGYICCVLGNVDLTAWAHVSLSKWTGSDWSVPYTQVSQYAAFTTDELNSNGEQNTGWYSLNTGKIGPKDGDYKGAEMDFIYCEPKGYFLSPKDKNSGGYASSFVNPDDDNDVEARIAFSAYY